MGGVRGVILDESVLLACDRQNENAFLRPAAEYILRKLRFSDILTGISYQSSLSAHKMGVLKQIAVAHACDCFAFNVSFIDSTLDEIKLSWGATEGTTLFVASHYSEDVFLKVINHGWVIIVPRSFVQDSEDIEGSSTSENSSVLYMNRLEELPLTICNLNKKAIGNNVLTVGFIMKPSREEDFAKRGALPMRPTQNGLIFLPLTFELPVSSQLKEVDVVLHKATDEIISIELSGSSEIPNKITYTSGMQELERYMEHHPDLCAIDPLNNIYPVLDRLQIQQILLSLVNLSTKGHKTVRGPHFLKVDNFCDPNLTKRLLEAKLSPPNIVKPQVACGVADAHNMAIVFRVEDYMDLGIPLPAVIQEYVDHSSSIFKFYVLGEEVFYAVKKSTPNADILMKLAEKNGLQPLVFDSLKSLPVSKENYCFGDEFNANNQNIDLELVKDAAQWLGKRLDLTIFGFDVVIQEGSGDHVIVDVNYLPSFKEVPDNIAVPAFWDAIKTRFDSIQIKRGKAAS